MAATATSHSTSRQCSSRWVLGETVRPALRATAPTHSIRAITCRSGRYAARTTPGAQLRLGNVAESKNPHRESAKLAPNIQVLTPGCPIASTQGTVLQSGRGAMLPSSCHAVGASIAKARATLTVQHTQTVEKGRQAKSSMQVIHGCPRARTALPNTTKTALTTCKKHGMNLYIHHSLHKQTATAANDTEALRRLSNEHTPQHPLPSNTTAAPNNQH